MAKGSFPQFYVVREYDSHFLMQPLQRFSLLFIPLFQSCRTSCRLKADFRITTRTKKKHQNKKTLGFTWVCMYIMKSLCAQCSCVCVCVFLIWHSQPNGREANLQFITKPHINNREKKIDYSKSMVQKLHTFEMSKGKPQRITHLKTHFSCTEQAVLQIFNSLLFPPGIFQQNTPYIFIWNKKIKERNVVVVFFLTTGKPPNQFNYIPNGCNLHVATSQCCISKTSTTFLTFSE